MKLVPVKELEKMVKIIAKEMGYHYADEISVRYNRRLRRTAARVFRTTRRIEFNPRIAREYLESLIRHEVAHLITNRGDRSVAFKEFCWENDIPLDYRGPLPSTERPKYHPYCDVCGKTFRSYIRYCKMVKRIEREPEACSCPNCKTRGRIKIKYGR